MKALLKNWLLPIKSNCFLIKNKVSFILILFFLFNNVSKSQIANYVNNGSFEIPKYANSQKAKYWDAIDTTKFVGLMYSAVINPSLVPLSSLTYQWPKTGNNWFVSTLFSKPNTNQNIRGYPRNTLKQTLQMNHTYCVKFYVNITTQTSYGIDAIAAYFGDNTTDTITQCMNPITYLTPQVQNPNNNIITDTLNWVPITGTFVASGTEKYMLLGNFKSDVATNTLLINPANLPLVFCDVLFDDVSVIDINLPAYAGPDIWGIPTTTVYLGRPQDVGIDEACMWYHLPNNTTAIDTAAGITITVAAITQTYMVKQDICGNIKYDTVVVYSSATGVGSSSGAENGIRLYPNPVSDILNIAFDMNEPDLKIDIQNTLGQIFIEQVITNKTTIIDTKELSNGIYFLNVMSASKGKYSKKFIIDR